MKPVTLTTRAAATTAATVAIGLGVALASTPVASADPSSGDSSSSANEAPSRTSKADRSAESSAEENDSAGAEENADEDTDEPEGDDSATPDSDDEAAESDTEAESASGSEALEQDNDANEDTVTRTVVQPVVTAVAAPEVDTSELPVNNNNVPSPVKWLQAAAARREVGDDAPNTSLLGTVSNSAQNQAVTAPVGASTPAARTINLGASPLTPGERIFEAAKLLLEPVRKLLVDLRLIPASRGDEVFPGSCVDGRCAPSTDIPVPQPSVQTIFVNLTGRALTLTNLKTNDPLAYGPQNGFVLGVNRQVEMAFYTNNDESTPSRGTMDWSAGSDKFSVYVNSSGASVTTSNANVQSDVYNTQNPVTGVPQAAVRQTVLFLPKAGTQITIDPTDGVGQAIVATAMCGVSGAGTCTQEAVDSTIEYTLPKNVGATLFNYGSINSTNTYEVSHEASKSIGIEENLKVVAGGSLNFSLLGITFQTEIGGVIQQKYGHSWTDGVLAKQGVIETVAPGKYGQIQLSYAQYHDFVNMTLTNMGVTITIPNVEYVSAVPENAVDEDGRPLAPPVWTIVDYDIGTGPDPSPNSTSTPTAPTNTKEPANQPVPPAIQTPAPAPAPGPKSFGRAIGDYLEAQFESFLRLPNVLFGDASARQLSTRGFEIVNLTPYTQRLKSISGEYESDESPAVGQLLAPFQMVRVEVDYASYGRQDVTIVWERTDATSITSTATLSNFPDGGSAVLCTNSACMDGGEDEANEAEVMYLIQGSPGTFDLTTNTSVATAALDAACAYGADNSTPGSCSVNVTGQSYFTEPVVEPWDTLNNRTSQDGAYTYSVTVYNSETNSWSVGGGIKLKEKSGVFIAQQLEIEATTLYTGSTMQKESETISIRQNLPSMTTGTLSKGDVMLRSYGDFVVNLPNATLLVRGQWIENASGLTAYGPVISLDDYPIQ